MIECVKMSLRGLELRIPSLTGADLEDHEAELNAIVAPKPEATLRDTIGAVCTLVLAACRETHPELTRETLMRHIDVHSQRAIFQVLVGNASGFEPVTPGEAPRP